MRAYTPEEWVLVKIKNPSSPLPYYKVFASWRGGYTTGDSWRMNSGVVSLEVIKDSRDREYFILYGASGSCYEVSEHNYGIRSPYNNSVLAEYSIASNGMIEILNDMPDLKTLDWNLSAS